MSKNRTNEIETLKAIRYLKKKDPILSSIMHNLKPSNVYRKRSSFESLIRIVIGQQLSSKAGHAIFSRVKSLFPKGRINIENLSQISDRILYEAGISKAKVQTIRSIAEEIGSGNLSFRRMEYMNDGHIEAQLMKIKGIGPWSVQMYLMFVLRRLDVFPRSDTGILNAIQRLYNGHEYKIEIITERWKPYRTVACWYLWRYLDG